MKKLLSFSLFLICFYPLLQAQQPTKIPHLEIPTITKKDVIIKHLGYTLSFNKKHEQANWVAYELTAEETKKGVVRTNHFQPDNAVKTGTATNDDYIGSGYDRGHLAPAADMSWSVQAMEESFLYSNMSPQVKGFNRGIWKKLEERVRQWAVENKDIYIVTGPVLKGNLHTIGPDKVSVPRYFYKVILDYTLPGLKGIGFIMPNASSTLPLQSYAVTIDSVEKVTGIHFFPSLPVKEEKAIEKIICIDCWSWTTTSTYKHSIKNKSTNFSKKLAIKVQCSAITKKGTRCKRMTSNPSGLCTQHEKERF